MKILFLGYEESPVLDFLKTQGEVTSVPPKGEIPQVACDCLISYGYRRIVSHEVLARYPNRAVNLHISMLPWNKGADPNFWSWWNDTPKGVSIIEMVDKLDEGRIYAQKEVTFSDNETIFSSYWKLRREIEKLFIELWPTIWTITPKEQIGEGSYHTVADLVKLSEQFPNAGIDPKYKTDVPVAVYKKLRKQS
jgi:methionyl-tRNA formyltransferase